MKKELLLAAALTGIFSGLQAKEKKTNEAPIKKVKCFGINACKGQGECAIKNNTCHATNACKGKGFLNKTEKECKKLKGSTTEPS